MLVDMELMECITEYAKKKHGCNLVYKVEIGPIVKIFKSEAGAWRYLERMGFRQILEPDAEYFGMWKLRYYSEEQLNAKRHYASALNGG